jgi:hydroxylamine dehydrogenase
MSKKMKIQQRVYCLLWIGLLVFGTGCTELSEVRKENQVLTEKSSQLQQEIEGLVKQYPLKEKPSPVKTTSNGVCKEVSSHEVGKHISWTLRPIVSNRINLVIYEDGHKEDYPDTQELPDIGEEVQTVDMVLQDEKLVKKVVSRHVSKIVTWQERREKMKDVCRNCHNEVHINNSYKQFDNLVLLYNEKFAKPVQAMMKDLIEDGVLNPNAPFEHEVQWLYWKLWPHEGRRTRLGASMMDPDYTHWHGMYEVARHFYIDFLPAVIQAASEKSNEIKVKYEQKIDGLLIQEEHLWMKVFSEEGVERLRDIYKDRYN